MKFQIKQALCSLICFTLFCLSAAQEQKTLPKIPTVAYCELVRQPAFYDNKVVRVTANYFVGFEGSLMSSPACGKEDTWVEFAAELERATPFKIGKKFDSLTDTSPEYNNGSVNYPSRQVKVTWVGLFQGIKATQTIGKQTFSLGFGHMNGFDFQFVAQKVEFVGKMVSK